MNQVEQPQGQDSGQDIKAILEEVQITQSPAYARGREDAFQEMAGKTHEDALKEIEDIAERFYSFLTKTRGIIPASYQVGMDRATRAPAIVVVLPKDKAQFLSEIMKIARDIEALYWEERSIDFSIWTFVDDHLDVRRLERDYPYIRQMD